MIDLHDVPLMTDDQVLEALHWSPAVNQKRLQHIMPRVAVSIDRKMSQMEAELNDETLSGAKRAHILKARDALQECETRLPMRIASMDSAFTAARELILALTRWNSFCVTVYNGEDADTFSENLSRSTMEAVSAVSARLADTARHLVATSASDATSMQVFSEEYQAAKDSE